MDKYDDSSYSPFTKMSRDQPNPLRPYYVPPSIGQTTGNTTSSSTYPPNTRPPPSSSSKQNYKDLFSDLDYGDYLPGTSPSISSLAKQLMDQAIWNYTSVLLAQPFEVAKVVLQCHDAGSMPAESDDTSEKRHVGRVHDYSFSDSDSDSEAPSYFSPTTPEETPSRRPSKRRLPSRTQSTASHSVSAPQSQTLRLANPDSVIEVISQLWGREGAFGIWKGTNSTFVYGVLLKTIETWTRSCLSAVLDIPDPTLFNAALGLKSLNGPTILDSPNPIVSLSVVVVAAGIAGCLLAPIDLVRTKLLITSTSSQPRAILPSLKSLPSLTIPTSLLPVTILHSSIPSFIGISLPLFFRHYLRIDPVNTPSTYSVTSFLTSLCELFVKLPFETVLRRGHVAILNKANEALPSKRPANILPLHTAGLSTQKFRPIVATGPYRGIVGSMLYIIYEEGRISPVAGSISMRPSSSLSNRSQDARFRATEKRGQGLKGLWRGWRVGFWGIVGSYAVAGLGPGSAGGEF